MANTPPIWSANADPIVGAGPAGTGLHRTRSGRLVNQNGNYVSDQIPRTMDASVRSFSPRFSSATTAAERSVDKPAMRTAPVAPARPRPRDPRAMQTFLRERGYLIPADGINGPLTQAAAADFRAGVNRRNPVAFNRQHGLAGAPAAAPAGTATAPSVAPPPATVTRPAPAAPAARTPATIPTGGLSDAGQAQQIIDEILSPIIQQIRDSYTARSKAGQQAIGGYTTNAVNQLAGLDWGSPYQGAIQGENAVNDALLARLEGQGSTLADSLAQKLAAAGQDTAGVTDLIRQDATGAANAGYATGNASLSNLIGEKAAAETYGRKLPGIESLAGLQASKAFQGQIAGQQQQDLGQIEARVPQMVQDTLGSLRTARSQDTALKVQTILASGYDPTTGSLTPDARAALSRLVGTPEGALAGAPKSTKPAAAVGQAKISTSVSKLLGYVADASGNPIVGGDGQIVPVDKNGSPAKSKAGGHLTAGQTQKYRGTAATIAQNAYQGFTTVDKDGIETQHPPINYQAALQEMRKEGVPLNLAQEALNQFFRPGERKRPFLSFQQRAALAKAGARPEMIYKAMFNENAASVLLKKYGASG